MAQQDSSLAPKPEGNAPLLSAIHKPVKQLIQLGYCLTALHVEHDPKIKDRLSAEIDLLASQLSESLVEPSTPQNLKLICGCFSEGEDSNVFSTRILGILLQQSLVNASGVFFKTLADVAQMGSSAAFLPIMVALAEMKVAGFVIDESGWIRLNPGFLEEILKIPHWLQPQLKALVEHNHQVTDDSMLL